MAEPFLQPPSDYLLFHCVGVKFLSTKPLFLFLHTPFLIMPSAAPCTPYAPKKHLFSFSGEILGDWKQNPGAHDSVFRV